MHFLFYKFQWTEWKNITIIDQGKGFYYAIQAITDKSNIEQTIKVLINKPVTADISIDEISKISKDDYELETGKPFYLLCVFEKNYLEL